jgi:hypothetical protein
MLVLLSFLDPSTSSSASLRSKAIYSLSGLLKHNKPAVEALGKPEADGWSKLRNALQGLVISRLHITGQSLKKKKTSPDPVISIRRKAIFLFSTLLIPESTTPESPTPTASAPQNTLEDSLSALSLTTTDVTPANPSIHLHDERPAPTPSSAPIHSNSHAAHLQNPSRRDTSRLTLAAFSEYNILDAIISGVTSPLPYGEDGENTEADDDFEEKAVR